jgi:hypothetical protein
VLREQTLAPWRIPPGWEELRIVSHVVMSRIASRRVGLRRVVVVRVSRGVVGGDWSLGESIGGGGMLMCVVAMSRIK